ncbi:hypothetical protein BX070DRAFT_235145 [Coemansia spiralis]|nr:hypothetical protein BX070DRAFT_235145 [Coemansia spiralis]
MLKGYALALQGVTELDIEAITYMQETNSSLEIEANDYKSEQRIAKEFVQLIPNVTRLNCLPIAATTHLRYMTFSKEIAKYYAPQLSMINSNPAGLQLVTRFSENLSSVALTIHDSSIIPESSIIPALLKNLHIINALDSSYWRAFVDYLGSTRITFRNLKKLAIDSSVGSRQLFQGDTAIWREQDYICPYKISAPALKQLQVDLCPPSYALAMSISLPERLETLVITVGCNIRLNLLKVQTGKVLNKLFSKDTLPSGVFNDEVLFANRVLNTPNLAKKISITIYTTREKIPTDIISWNRLSCLTIVRRINFANLLVLIGKLPNLSELNAEAVECIARKGNFVLPSLAMIRNDEYTPLNTKIISASLKCMVYGTTQDNPADTITEYLKARIATLKHVYISAY